MSQLLSQLGVDWRLLLSQAVNFFVLLVVLRMVVYKPLLAILEARRERIAAGLTKADEADRRLLEADEMKKSKIREGEMEAVGILKKTESDAQALEAKLLAEAKRKEAAELANLESLLRAKEDESRRAVEKEAAALVRRAIARTVALAPQHIDDALIAKAVAEAKSLERPGTA